MKCNLCGRNLQLKGTGCACDEVNLIDNDDPKRDDTGLHSIICPHCKQTAAVLRIQAFKAQQLVFLRCDKCDQPITKQQISDAFREYQND